MSKKRKLTKEYLKQAVAYIFNTTVVYNNSNILSKEERNIIEVIYNDKWLSFKIKTPAKSLRMGLEGFKNFISINGFNNIKLTHNIIYNGVKLNEKQLKEFWHQIDKKFNNEL